MASNYTAHYGLCQWEPGDNFIRSEFNGDNQKIDAAITAVRAEMGVTASAAERALAGLVPVSYNVYQLMLQNYYDGQKTAQKKALVFDGFQDKAMIGSMTSGLTHANGQLSLMRSSQQDINLGYSGSTSLMGNYCNTQTRQVGGNCLLTGFTLKLNEREDGLYSAPADYHVTVNGTVVQERTFTCTITASPQEVTVSVSPSVTLAAGDQFSFGINIASSAVGAYKDSAGQMLGGTFLLSPVGANVGTVTTPVLDLPDRQMLRGWVRFQNGQVSLSVVDSGGVETALTAGNIRKTINIKGQSCSEQEFVLDTAAPKGAYRFKLGLDLAVSSVMWVYDYGITLI